MRVSQEALLVEWLNSFDTAAWHKGNCKHVLLAERVVE